MFSSFQKLANSRFKFGLFMLLKLPSAWLCGVRVQELDEQHAVVSVPFKWLSQNPFKSIYFACQAMAAEMSTGLLAMGHVHGRQPAVSMLVTGMQARFIKKANGNVRFICYDGAIILQAIEKAIQTGAGQTVTAVSTGRNSDGELVSEFVIEWSFKSKQQ